MQSIVCIEIIITMKKLSFLLLLFVFSTQIIHAQYRADLPGYYDYTGPLINERAPTVQSGLDRFFSSVKMSHSYSMNFNSFGGNYQNVNAYTNTMQFQLSERMNGRVDISFLHSPFGGNQNFAGANNFQNQVIIRNAELNYKLSDNAFIRVQYQQLPRGFGYGYNPYGFNRFNRFRNNMMWY
jgi:hypothetical protein